MFNPRQEFPVFIMKAPTYQKQTNSDQKLHLQIEEQGRREAISPHPPSTTSTVGPAVLLPGEDIVDSLNLTMLEHLPIIQPDNVTSMHFPNSIGEPAMDPITMSSFPGA